MLSAKISADVFGTKGKEKEANFSRHETER